MNIQYLELELTSRCNAKCSVCPRYKDAELNPNFITTDITLADIRDRISDDTWQNIKTVVLKGTVGDAGSNPYLYEILEYLNSKNVMISLHTNGAVKTGAWWQKVAANIPNLSTRFCVDGIDADTHFMYRQTNFEKVIENACQYISAGGDAEWFFIIFKHNEHQIMEARNLAQQLGFTQFTAVYSDRYDLSHNTKSPNSFNENAQSYKWRSNLEKKVLWPGNDFNINNWVNKLEAKVCICPNIDSQQVYIAADGYVWPCCFYGSSNLTVNNIFWNFYKVKVLGNDLTRTNIKHNSLDSILKDPVWEWWQEYIRKFNPKTCQKYCA